MLLFSEGFIINHFLRILIPRKTNIHFYVNLCFVWLQQTQATVSWGPAGCCGSAWYSGCCSWSCSVSTSSSAPPWPAPSPGLRSRWSPRTRRPVCTQSRTSTPTGPGQAASTAAGSASTTRAPGPCQLPTSAGLWALTTPAHASSARPASRPPTPASRQSQPTQTPDQVHSSRVLILESFLSCNVLRTIMSSILMGYLFTQDPEMESIMAAWTAYPMVLLTMAALSTVACPPGPGRPRLSTRPRLRGHARQTGRRGHAVRVTERGRLVSLTWLQTSTASTLGRPRSPAATGWQWGHAWVTCRIMSRHA